MQPSPLIFSQKGLLNQLEQSVEGGGSLKRTGDRKTLDATTTKKETNILGESRKKALKKQDAEFGLFKEIFVNPKEERLNELQEKGRQFIGMVYEGSKNQYDKILDIKKEDRRGLRSYYEPRDNQQLSPSRAQIPPEVLAPQPPGIQKQGSQKTEDDEKTFFDQQIQVQPPDLPNASLASPLTPGNGWAPSIPPTNPDIVAKPNLKDLLVRAKAGMQAGDIQKEAHLTFYLGMLQENSENFTEAIRYYKKYLNCAKSLEDRIGMALAMNRLGTNLFKLGKFEKSVEAHMKHLELTSAENSFAAYYNLGICFRYLKRFEDSLLNFRKALEWSRDQQDLQSECLSLGQIGVTFLAMGNKQDGKEHLEECYNISSRLRNNKLQLDCLMYLSKFSPQERKTVDEFTVQRFQEAYKCAKAIGDRKHASVCLINMGVMEGSAKLDEHLRLLSRDLSQHLDLQ